MMKEFSKKLGAYFARPLSIKLSVAIVFIIYCLSMIAIWRANYSYLDDTQRAIDGYAWNHDFGRYSSSLLSYLLNINFQLVDLSPWTQIVAMMLLAIASVATVYVLCNKRLTIITLLPSLFVGITPFALGCWVYKFDAPCMALSILASVAPFILYSGIKRYDKRSTVIYTIVTVICLLIMLTSYQASSGVFLVLTFGVLLHDLLNNSRINLPRKKSLIMLALNAIAYILAGIIFIAFIPHGGYRDTVIPNMLDIPVTLFKNVASLVDVLVASLNTEWRVLVVVSILSIMVMTLVGSRKRGANKIFDLLLIIVATPVVMMMSYGVYVFLYSQQQMYADWGRCLIGVGFAIATICISVISLCTHYKPGSLQFIVLILLGVPIMILLYSFFVYAIAFGNCIADQQRYANIKNAQLEYALSDIGISNDTHIYIPSSIGPSAVTKHISEQYPVTQFLLGDNQFGLGAGWGVWGYIYMQRYDGLKFVYDGNIDCSELKNKKETSLFTIQYDDGMSSVCVSPKGI